MYFKGILKKRNIIYINNDKKFLEKHKKNWFLDEIYILIVKISK